jgi:hypothetical protein
MAEKVYKLFIGHAKEAWYQLSDEEKKAKFDAVEAAMAECGGKRVIACRSRWSDELNGSFGIEEYPDIEAVQKYALMLEKLEWFRYVESKSYLGTEWTE